MAHKSTALQIAGRVVRVVNVDNRLYVPLRFLVEETLDMRWEGQRKRLAALARRWKMADLLVSGQRKVLQQPCLPVGLVLPYLWLLRPTRPETLALLERVRDGWDGALMAYLLAEQSELASIGSFLVAEVEKIAGAWMAKSDTLEAELAKAKKARPVPAEAMARERWKNQSINGDSFREIARLNELGKTPTEIAKAVGCSRSTAALFLAGKYKTGVAEKVMDELLKSGLKIRRVTAHKHGL